MKNWSQFKTLKSLFMKTFIFLLLILTLGAFDSCQKNHYVSDNPDKVNQSEKTALLIEADNAFGLNLFLTIRNESKEENLLVSPFSVSVALAMAYNGAGTETKAEMEETMKLKGLTKEQINKSYQKLISELQSLDEKVVFEIANSLFYADGFSVKQEFMEVNSTVYDAEIKNLNFASPSAIENINNWVNEKTHGKIEKIIQQLNPLDRMVLLNAIYFFGTWTQKFDEHGTRNLEFVKNDGTNLEVPMMNKLEKLPYLAEQEFKAIKIPYGNGQYTMVVILPGNEFTSREIIGKLTAENWKTWMSDFEITERVDITMPRFKFAFESSLNNALIAMGMQKAFLPETADFSGISEEDLYISEIRHKAYIDVNETGTEAAAVTSVVFAATSMRDEPPVVPFFVNKPFIFAITENSTGAILFLGEVNHPEYN